MGKAFLRRLRGLLPVWVRKVAYRVGCFLGDHVAQTPVSLEATLECLRRWGFRPTAAIDIGAYHGDWTRLFKKVFPLSKVLMIEGQIGKAGILRETCQLYSGDVMAETALLGAEDGRRVRFVEMETGSSVFEEASRYGRHYVEKTLVTLDSLLKDHPTFGKSDFLKLDVQGYELEVLRGATEALHQATFVLLEASLIPVNEGCPLISEVIAFMAAKEYRLLDFCSEVRRRDGALWQTDLLFVRQTSPFLPRPSLDSDNWV